MEPQINIIYKNSNLIDLLALISGNEKLNKENYFAVLESLDNPVLVGSFKIRHAIDYISAEWEEIENKLKSGTTNSDLKYQKYFQNLKNEAGIEINSAGDSNVVQISSDLKSFLQSMITYETKYHTDREGKIIEEKVLIGREKFPARG